MYNDIINELGTNFIEYAVAVNTDRSIPNATDGLKPVAKRILYSAFDCGFRSDKPHVKCASVVGNVMADWHPHGDSSIYGALVRLSQPWIMRYPLIDFHGSNGNIDGDGPAAYRYTESRLSKLTEEGMLVGIKKKNIDFIPNYSETKDEPVELPAIFPNLLCNPNSGIGVAIASSWACHNLNEVAQAIYDYIDGKEPMLPGPDFPTGGVIINKDVIPSIMKTGHGTVKIRGKYHMEDTNIVFTEIPYGVGTESLMTQIGESCDNSDIIGINDIRNESNKKGFRLVIECEKTASISTILNKLFAKTDLQTNFSYNQVALVDKTPTELNLQDCIKIYIDHNSKCITREVAFDIKKTKDRLHIIAGLLKALDIINDIISMIKTSESAAAAKQTLMSKWNFSEEQSKAILDMKLARLAKLEKIELETEEKELNALLILLEEIYNNPIPELRKRLAALVQKFGDARRTELTQITETKEEQENQLIEPEEVMVVITENNLIKRVPLASSFKVQKRGGKGIKNKDGIVKQAIKTNTVDTLLCFSNLGKMYKLSIDAIPAGTNISKGVPISSLIQTDNGEVILNTVSLFKNANTDYILFVTKNGTVKKTLLSEYTSAKKKTGIVAISLREGDSVQKVTFVTKENLIIVTQHGYSIRFSSEDIAATGRTTTGVKGISLEAGDTVIDALPIRHDTDCLGIISVDGNGKKVPLNEFPIQGRGGKGVKCTAKGINLGGIALLDDTDNLCVVGSQSLICISATDLPLLSRSSQGNIVLAQPNQITAVVKI